MSVLLSIQAQALAALQADESLRPIKLISRRKHNIKNEILTTLGKVGICALVLTPSSRVRNTNAPGPMLDPVLLFVDVIENVIINQGGSGSKIPAEDVAERIAWRLHSANHPARHDPHTFICEDIEEISDDTFLAYRVKFRTAGMLPGLNQET